MRVNIGKYLFLAGVLGILAACGAARAADSAAPSSGGSSHAAATPKDPVATAFALPKGVALNRRQQAAYDSLKQAQEPKLRKAIEQVHGAGDEKAKIKAAREAKDIRAEIRAKIDEILNTPYSPRADKGSDSANSPEGSSDGGYGPQGGPVPYYYPYRYPYAGYYPYYNPYYYPPRSDKGTGSTPNSKSGSVGPRFEGARPVVPRARFEGAKPKGVSASPVPAKR